MGAQKNTKIKRFLKAVERAKTLEAVNVAAKAGKFSQSELRLLYRTLKAKKYRAKLKRLGQKSKQGKSLKGNVSPFLAKAKQKHNKKHRQKVNRRNRDARNAWKKVKQTPMQTTIKAIKTTHLTPKMTSSMRSYGGRDATASIMSISIPARIGRYLSIHGDGFGSSPGQVVILARRNVVECPIQRWRNRQIDITVPMELGGILGSRPLDGILWVKLGDTGLGPTIPIPLAPVEPRIRSLGGRNFGPGEEILISGVNFMPRQETGRVTAELLHSRRSPGEITVINWQDDAILIRLPEDTTGEISQRCRLTVEAPSGLNASSEFTFIPVMEVKERHSRVVEIDNYTDRSSFSEFCYNFFGLKDTLTYYDGVTLHNQWTVLDARASYSGGGAGHGATIKEHPVVGSRRPRTKMEYWADGWAWVRAKIIIVIVGPRGTSSAG